MDFSLLTVLPKSAEDLLEVKLDMSFIQLDYVSFLQRLLRISDQEIWFLLAKLTHSHVYPCENLQSESTSLHLSINTSIWPRNTIQQNCVCEVVMISTIQLNIIVCCVLPGMQMVELALSEANNVIVLVSGKPPVNAEPFQQQRWMLKNSHNPH